MLTIDIVSDVVCPWCYIGERHLERALEDFAGAYEIRWHPFQLNPDLALAGIDRRHYLETKFGGAERAQQVYKNIEDAASRANLELALNAIKTQPNTLAAHTLIAYAQQIDAASASRVARRLFYGYFVEGKAIGEIDTLCELAAQSGFDRSATRAFITDPIQLNAVAERDKALRQQGISSVPFFIFNGQRAVSGAQPPEALKTVIAQSVTQAAGR